MAEDGRLTILVGDETVSGSVPRGSFSWSVQLDAPKSDAITVTAESTKAITPEGPNGRKLAFVLREIELSHED
jgi:hypothetical protein